MIREESHVCKIVASTHDMYLVKSLQISFVQSDKPSHCSHIVALIASKQQAKTKHMSPVIRKPTFWSDTIRLYSY